MPRQPSVHYDKKRDRHYFTAAGKKYTRKHYADAVKLLGKLLDVRSAASVEIVAQLVELWLVKNGDQDNVQVRFRLRPWCEFEGDVALRDLGRDALDRLLEYLRTETVYAPKTIRDMVTTASQVCRWAYRRNYLPELPLTPKLPKAPAGHKDIPVRELARKLGRLNKPQQARVLNIAKFIQATGCRPIRARLLEWREVDFEEKRITIDAHKTAHVTGEPLVIPLEYPEAVEALQEAAERDARGGYVFLSRLRTPYTAAGLRSILKRVGILPYQLRHTFAQSAIDEGAGLDDVGKLMNHKDPRSTLVYCEIRDRRAAVVARNLTSPLRRGIALASGPDAEPEVQDTHQAKPRRLATAG